MKPNVRTFTSLIVACGRAGRLDKALGLRRHMERAGITPNLFTFNSLLAACACVGQLDVALEVSSSQCFRALHNNMVVT